MKNITNTIKKATDWIKQNIKHLKPSKPAQFLTFVGLGGLLAFTIIRFVFFLRNADMLNEVETSLIVKAFWTGIRYDIVVTFYTLIIPIVLLSAAQFTQGLAYRILTKSSVVFLAVFYSIFIMCSIGDIPFYEHFSTHVNAFILKYAESGPVEAIKMIVNDGTYLTFFISSIISAAVFCYFIHKMSKRFLSDGPTTRRKYTITVAVLFLAFGPMWCRGLYFQDKPMFPKDAYISDNKTVNEIAKSPIYIIATSIKSLLKGGVDLIDPKIAIDFAKQELGRDDNFVTHHEAKESPFKHIIIILQEGSSAERLAYEGYHTHITPTLDRLIYESCYFENAYSSNTRTCCGVYSIVSSLPAYGPINPTCDCYYKLPTLFNEYRNQDGFSTVFFMTHDRHYDNLLEFLSMQGFNKIYSQEDYGVSGSKLKTWGVDDHIMLDFAINKIDQEINSGKRVLATCLTCSNHSPFNAPLNVGFTPAHNGTDEEIAIQYADWSLNRFIEAAKQKSWFDDTLFIITGDHGRAFTNDFEIPESQVHIPLLFYSPKHIAPEIRKDLAAQIDITPTAFAMAGLEFKNHTLGIDLNSQQRHAIPYGNYTCVAARNEKWNYIYNMEDEVSFLYNLEDTTSGRYHNVVNEYPEAAKEMHHYAACMTQAGWAIHTNALK